MEASKDEVAGAVRDVGGVAEGGRQAHGAARRGRVLFAFALPTAHELQRWEGGGVPSHRLWGLVELRSLGWDVELCPDPEGVFRSLGSLGWRLWQTLWMLRLQRSADCIVSVHEVAVLPLLAARFLGSKGAPVAILNLAILHEKNQRGIRLLLWRALLRKAASVVSLVEAQCLELAQVFRFPLERSFHLPMAVDPAFLGTARPGIEERFCLAVGTNDGKDFETLLAALPLGERLVVVTDSYNAAKVRAHPCFGNGVEVLEAVPATQLRDLYLRAAVVIVPLADTAHGSGHTVLLETMAMGKVVIVSESRSMRGYIDSGRNVLSVPVSDVKAMRAALLEALNGSDRLDGVRQQAALDARTRFGISGYGRKLSRLLERLAGGGAASGGLEGLGSGVAANSNNHAYIP